MILIDGPVKSVVDGIVSRYSKKEDIRELLSYLATVDWEAAIAEKEYECSLRPCGICHEWKDTHTYKNVHDTDGSGSKYKRACIECCAEINLTLVCVVCGTCVPALSLSRNDFVCIECSNVHDLVLSHNSRARLLKLPATLTTRQWANTLRHFDNRCAYCAGKNECLEHYVPLTSNGGTTMGNCVPSCVSCNIRKSNSHPDTINQIFPPENLQRIREWLQLQCG